MDRSFEVVPVEESIEEVVATFSCNKCPITTNICGLIKGIG
jgi:hypothetical protein